MSIITKAEMATMNAAFHSGKEVLGRFTSQALKSGALQKSIAFVKENPGVTAVAAAGAGSAFQASRNQHAGVFGTIVNVGAGAIITGGVAKLVAPGVSSLLSKVSAKEALRAAEKEATEGRGV